MHFNDKFLTIIFSMSLGSVWICISQTDDYSASELPSSILHWHFKHGQSQ